MNQNDNRLCYRMQGVLFAIQVLHIFFTDRIVVKILVLCKLADL